MRKIKVGVIGVGNMGKNHVRIYSEIADLVSVSDINDKRGREIASKYKTRFYKNYRQMLKEEQIDAISVVVPTSLHKDIVFDCLKKQIPTFVEKPIAGTLSDARKMLQYAKKYKTLLMVGHVERFNPVIVKLKKIIDEGRLGKIISLLAIRVGITPPNPAASDVALDLGIHDVDVFNFLLGRFPENKKVLKTKLFSKNTADSSTILLEYGKVTGMIQTNWITPVKMRKLFCSGVEGYAELDLILQKLVLHDKILNTRFDGSFYELVSLSEDAPKRQVYISKKEPLKEELLYFLSKRMDWRENNIKDATQALKIVL